MSYNNYPDDVIDNRDTEFSDIEYGVIIGTHSPITNLEKPYFRGFTVQLFKRIGVHVSSIKFEDRIVKLKIHAGPSVAPLQIVNEFKELSASKLNEVFQETTADYFFYWYGDYFITTKPLTINDMDDFRAARIV